MPGIKSQDIVLLLKLVSLERQRDRARIAEAKLSSSWMGWASGPEQASAPDQDHEAEAYAVRSLEFNTGISKSEVSGGLRRSRSVGLLRTDRRSGRPQVNTQGLLELIQYGLKYFFPAEPGALTRGIPTAHAAPVLAGRLIAAGDDIYVWPDAQGLRQGQGIAPLHRCVPIAVRRDAWLYGCLALVDSIRIGRARESIVAAQLLQSQLGIKP